MILRLVTSLRYGVILVTGLPKEFAVAVSTVSMPPNICHSVPEQVAAKGLVAPAKVRLCSSLPVVTCLKIIDHLYAPLRLRGNRVTTAPYLGAVLSIPHSGRPSMNPLTRSSVSPRGSIIYIHSHALRYLRLHLHLPHYHYSILSLRTDWQFKNGNKSHRSICRYCRPQCGCCGCR